jgi:hypothetical protein
VSDIDVAVVDCLKALDLKWPIREVDIIVWPCRCCSIQPTQAGAELFA